VRQTELERFRGKLVDMQTRLAAQINVIDQALAEDIRAAGDLSNIPTHPADRDSESLDSEIAVAESEGAILEQVEGALGRIEQGTYGKCEECGDEISAERLEAIPYAAYCIDCQRRQEAA
jgi:RNA polymerase-binding protein DksA